MTHVSDSYQPYISREQLTFSLPPAFLRPRRLWWLLWLTLLPGGKGQDLVGRFFHQTVIVNDKLYVIGGQQNVGHARYNFCNTSLTLDLNASFNVYNPPWRNDDVTTVNMFLTARHSLSLVTSLDHQSQLLMYGGDTPRGRQASGPLWSYIPEDDTWAVVKPNRTLPWRSGHTAVTDTLRNRVYFYGGQVQGASSTSYSIDNTEFSVLDVSAQQWLSTSQEFSTTGTSPGARENHGAVLLNDTHFLLLGGLTTARQPADARTIYLLDIPSQRWSYRSTRGAIPSRLSSFTLNAYKNMLIIYGGRTNDGTSDYYDQFLTLDTRQTTWTWERKTPKDAPPGRYGHGAVLFDKYLLITFGYTSEGADHRLYVLDAETFRMVDNFNVSQKSPQATPSRSSTNDIPTWKIAIIAVASVLGLLLLLGIGWWCFRRRLKEEGVPPTVPAGVRGVQVPSHSALVTSLVDETSDEYNLISRAREPPTPSQSTTPLASCSTSSFLRSGPFIGRLNSAISTSATSLLGLPQWLVNREINLPTPMEVPSETVAHRVELVAIDPEVHRQLVLIETRCSTDSNIQSTMLS